MPATRMHNLVYINIFNILYFNILHHYFQNMLSPENSCFHGLWICKLHLYCPLLALHM